MDDLAPETVADIWDSGSAMRLEMARRKAYYNGDHAIVGRNQTYVDGSSKSEIVSNFIAYAVDLYAGSIAGKPYGVSALETDDAETEGDNDNAGSDTYRAIGENNNFDAQDTTNLINALVCGYGVELHEYRDDAVITSARDPLMWYPVFNSDDEFIGIIYRSKLYAGTFYKDELLEDDLDLMVLYTKRLIRKWVKHSGKKNAEWLEESSVQHFYGDVPVVLWAVNEKRKSIITNDIIAQQDEYNDADSSSGDTLRQDTDGVLAIEGYSAKNIQENSETIREFKLLPVPQGGKAYFITKPTDSTRIKERIQRTRSHIFMGFKVPDIEEVTGATGSTSGIALRLKFKPMMDNAAYFIANLRQGVRRRIELINAIQRRVSPQETIGSVNVSIDFSLPVNRVEEWQNIKNLDGVVSKRKQLEVLTDVYDVEQEERRLQKEREDEQFIARTDGTVEDIAQRNDAEIESLSESIRPQLQTVIDSISDAALTVVLERQRESDNPTD